MEERSRVTEATPQDWEDFWYSPEKFGSWHVNDSEKESMKKTVKQSQRKD